MHCVYVLKFSNLMFYSFILHMLIDIHDMGSCNLYSISCLSLMFEMGRWDLIALVAFLPRQTLSGLKVICIIFYIRKNTNFEFLNIKLGN